MRTKDEALMKEIVDAINEFYSRKGRTPTTREIGSAVGLSHVSVLKYLQEMNGRGMLEYDRGKIITEKITKSKSDSVTVPILGSVSCGMPLTEEENIDSYVKLPVELVGHGDFFLLKANGDSMIDANIDDGDFVLIRKTTEANDGDIVVALIENETTLKRLYHDDKQRKIILHPENKDFDDIVVDYCEIQGVAVKVLKDL